MINLREKAESDLKITLEGQWGLPVVLISPAGVKQSSPIVLSVTDLSFLTADKSINSVTTNFLRFRISVGDTITISGTVSNDGAYTVSTILKNKMTVEESIVTEVAGATVVMVNDSLDLKGQIIYDTLKDNPQTGQEMIVHKPVVTLRKTSLLSVPISGERWYCEIPLEPRADAAKFSHVMERPAEDGSSIGFIRLYMVEADQL